MNKDYFVSSKYPDMYSENMKPSERAAYLENINRELADALTELAEYAAAEIGLQVQDCVAGPIGKARDALAKAKGES